MDTRSFLAEARRLIRRAIRDRLKLRIIYDGRERVVEPHQLVEVEAEVRETQLEFESGGQSWLEGNQDEASAWAGSPGPDGLWLRFTIIKIESIELLDEHFRVRDSFRPTTPVNGRVEARV